MRLLTTSANVNPNLSTLTLSGANIPDQTHEIRRQRDEARPA